MSRKKKKKGNRKVSELDLYRQVRGSWDGINPVTRIVESKKKKPPKYKHKQLEEE